MKMCPSCGQLVAEEIHNCPSCGSEVAEGRKSIDDYRIVDVLREGYSSILCKARREADPEPVMIRIFTPAAGVNEAIAARLTHELEELQKLPPEYFVRHLEIRRSEEGLWYRVSEWVDAESWGDLLAGGRLSNLSTVIRLFYRIAAILDGLHRIGHTIPHLILDDILVVRGSETPPKVVIDYKLSRFLDPKLDRPRPMLQKLLETHPDICNRRPLDHRSDIWSLAKLFVEILSADLETRQYLEKIDGLEIPEELAVLLKVMLADEPVLRPENMTAVVDALAKISKKKIRGAQRRRRIAADGAMKELLGLRKRLYLLGAALALIALVVGLAWIFYPPRAKDPEQRWVDIANRYAGSVAFIVADYRLVEGERTVYQNRTEGTGFLVGREGFLLTNRHVACPWLEDEHLQRILSNLQPVDPSVGFSHRLFLWFEGEQAFNRLPGVSLSDAVEDVYAIDRAFCSDCPKSVTIAGVGRLPAKTRQMLLSPLGNDFAVLRITPVPDNLTPLPLDVSLDVSQIARLSPVITLGFPLGSRTQESSVKVSVTSGHVRRVFENAIQIDSSIYHGNSGGPVIDQRGKVIGIASRAAVNWTMGRLPMATVLSDLGQVMPIAPAAAFLEDIRAGRPKWNGMLDPSLDGKLERIGFLVRQQRWQEAKDLAEKLVVHSKDPAVLHAAGVLRLCTGDPDGARSLFSIILAMDPSDERARFMIYLVDGSSATPVEEDVRLSLLSLEWHSPFEFFAYLVQVLEKKIPATEAVTGGESRLETAWLNYAAGLLRERQNDRQAAGEHFAKACLEGWKDPWLQALALAGLRDLFGKPPDEFIERLAAAEVPEKERRQAVEQRRTMLRSLGYDSALRRKLLEEIYAIDESDQSVLLELVFTYAAQSAWQEALECCRKRQQPSGRESARTLTLGWLEPVLLARSGHVDDAEPLLTAYVEKTRDPWHADVGRCLLGRLAPEDLFRSAGNRPELLLSGHTALGLWREAQGEPEVALRHYKESLSTYLDDWPHYFFSLARMQQLRKGDS